MKFIPINDNVLVREDAIESIILDTDETFKIITTSNNVHSVSKEVVESMLTEEKREIETNRLTTQFFGG